MKIKTVSVPDEIEVLITKYAEEKGLSFSKAMSELAEIGLQRPPVPQSLDSFIREAIQDRTLYLSYTIFEIIKTIAPEYDSEKVNKKVVDKLAEFKKLAEAHYAKKTS